MAQHDYDIENSSFPAFRTNLNGVLDAINSSNSGTSRPSSAVSGTIWLDTTSATTPTLKYYDGSAWQNITADTDVKTKVSSNDSTAGFLNGKLVAGDNVTFTENNNGSNETLTIAATDPTALAIALG